MQRLFVLIVALLVATACQAPPPETNTEADVPPADTSTTAAEPAVVESLPGFLGQTEIETPIPGYEGEQYWTDSDGVDPAVAGCHFPFSGMSDAGECTGSLAPAGVFGEFCNPPEGDPMHQPGFPVGALIESNPAAGVCHPHKDGLGHPDVYDCDAFCKGTESERHTGTCVADVCTADAAIPSARCECTAPSA